MRAKQHLAVSMGCFMACMPASSHACITTWWVMPCINSYHPCMKTFWWSSCYAKRLAWSCPSNIHAAHSTHATVVESAVNSPTCKTKGVRHKTANNETAHGRPTQAPWPLPPLPHHDPLPTPRTTLSDRASTCRGRRPLPPGAAPPAPPPPRPGQGTSILLCPLAAPAACSSSIC